MTWNKKKKREKAINEFDVNFIAEECIKQHISVLNGQKKREKKKYPCMGTDRKYL